MITELQSAALGAPSISRSTRPGRDLAFGALGALALAAASCWLLGVPTSHVAQTALLYGALSFVLLRRLPRNHAGPGIGAANRVTLARATLVLPVAALTLQPGMLVLEGVYWWVIALSTGAMALDFVDGRVARSTGTSSAFGARFDMETDAFLLLALSVLAWQSGKVGLWVILIGGLRYLFVGTAYLWPALDGALPESFRRKAVCVAQGITLIACMVPFIGPTVSSGLTAMALAALVYSFAVDVRWLASHPAPAQ